MLSRTKFYTNSRTIFFSFLRIHEQKIHSFTNAAGWGGGGALEVTYQISYNLYKK